VLLFRLHLTESSSQALGQAEPSYVSRLLDENDEAGGGEEGESIARDGASSIYAGKYYNIFAFYLADDFNV
jgi:hypothetical protein